MKKEYIIPIFVPNLGCPYDCTFCNQEKISGAQTDVDAKKVRETIEYYLKNFKDDHKYVEVAFFGGSFTGIDRRVQEELLQEANKYIKAKKVNSIRISTRPDYINRKILKMLKKSFLRSGKQSKRTQRQHGTRSQACLVMPRKQSRTNGRMLRVGSASV